MEAIRALRQMPVAYKVTYPIRMLLLPVGLVLLLTGSALPGVILMTLWILDTAIVTPLLLRHFRDYGSREDAEE